MFRFLFWLVPLAALAVNFINHEIVYVLFLFATLGGFTEHVEKSLWKPKSYSMPYFVGEIFFASAVIVYLFYIKAVFTPLAVVYATGVYIAAFINVYDRVNKQRTKEKNSLEAEAKRQAALLNEAKQESEQYNVSTYTGAGKHFGSGKSHGHYESDLEDMIFEGTSSTSPTSKNRDNRNTDTTPHYSSSAESYYESRRNDSSCEPSSSSESFSSSSSSSDSGSSCD